MRQSHQRKLSGQTLYEREQSGGSIVGMGRGSVADGMRATSGSREDLFSCLLCVESFRKPKILECQHAFCEQCLQLYYKTYKGIQYEQQGVFVPCPTCRKLTKVPTDGLIGLDHHRYDDRMVELKRKMSTISGISIQKCDVCVFKNKLEESEYYCSKCLLNFCGSCKTAHSQEVLFKAHTVIHISNKETIQLTCDTHNKLPSQYYCQDCNIPLCTVCVMHEHSSHNTMKLHDALSMRRDNVKTLLNCLGPKMDKIEAKVKKLAYLYVMKSRGYGNKNGMSRSVSEVTDMTSQTNCGVPADPKSRKFSLMDIPQNRECTEQDLNIQNKYCQVERARKVYDLASKITEMSQSKKLLAIYEDILWRIQAIIEVEMKQIEDEVGDLLEKEEDTMNELMQQMTAGSNCSNGHHERATSLSSGGTDDSSSLDEAIFDQPQQSLLIKPKLLWKVEKQKNDPGELLNPCDICFLGDNVVVAEYDNMNDRNNRLHIFDSVGKSVQVIAQGQIRPLGVTLTREGNIAVTDCKGKRVKVFTPTGQLMSEWGKGQFGWPYGIAVNSKGQIIVSDAFNDTISIHQPDGKKVKQFGSSGANSNQFRNPYHVTCDQNDNIIVSDCGNHCFKVYDVNGQYLYRSSDIRRGSPADSFMFESKRKRRKLRGPRGIAIDLKSNILVADDNSRVCMFDSRGKYVRNVLTDEDSVKYAEGVATNSKGLLAVTEWNPSNMFAVKVFSLYE